MIDIHHYTRGDDNMVCVTLEGRLTQREYLVFGPHLESTIRHFEDLRLVFILDDTLRWEARSMWRGMKLDSRHRTSIARLAVVGGSWAWQKWLLTACGPLKVAEAMVFPSFQKRLAMVWAGAAMASFERRI